MPIKKKLTNAQENKKEQQIDQFSQISELNSLSSEDISEEDESIDGNASFTARNPTKSMLSPQ